MQDNIMMMDIETRKLTSYTCLGRGKLQSDIADESSGNGNVRNLFDANLSYLLHRRETELAVAADNAPYRYGNEAYVIDDYQRNLTDNLIRLHYQHNLMTLSFGHCFDKDAGPISYLHGIIAKENIETISQQPPLECICLDFIGGNGDLIHYPYPKVSSDILVNFLDEATRNVILISDLIFDSSISSFSTNEDEVTKFANQFCYIYIIKKGHGSIISQLLTMTGGGGGYGG